MFPDYYSSPYLADRLPRPDRRPAPTENEIRLRVKRAVAAKAA